MAGITDSGFQRKTLTEILESLQVRFAQKLGDDWNTAEDSVENQFISVFAEEVDQVWQGMSNVYKSQTIDSEGVYLDDVLAQQGWFRKGKSKGGGEVVVFADLSLATQGYTINSGRTILGSNDKTYVTTSEKDIDTYMSCYKLSVEDLADNQTYTFSIYSTTLPTTNTFSWTTGTSLEDKQEMLLALSQFANNNLSSVDNVAYFDVSTNTMFIAFESKLNIPDPLPKGELHVNPSPLIGDAGYRISCEALEEGFFPLPLNSVSGLSPSFTGYDSVVNWQAFSSGTEVQTDADYRLSYLNNEDGSVAGTPARIKLDVLEVSGVEGVEIYENPTNNFIYDLDNNLVANPFTYNTVVLGGSDLDVAKAIGSNSPVNVTQYGTTEVSYTDEAGNTVDVEFSRATYYNYGVKVTYQTKDGTQLTDVERQEVNSLMIELTNSLGIGATILIEQVRASVYRALPLQRVVTVSVELIDLSVSGSQYVSTDLIPPYNKKPQLLTNDIVYQRG